jgi:hypothetical protein
MTNRPTSATRDARKLQRELERELHDTRQSLGAVRETLKWVRKKQRRLDAQRATWTAEAVALDDEETDRLDTVRRVLETFARDEADLIRDLSHGWT